MMSIEEIASMDFFIKNQNGTENLLAINKLFLTSKDQKVANTLRESALTLNEIGNTVARDEKNQYLVETWKNLFSRQVKFSVELAKKMAADQKEKT